MTNTPEPNTTFDWTIYADATFAGLAVLIPIPLVDLLFESFFRSRMPGAIARRRGQALSPEIKDALTKTPLTLEGCLRGCLIWPLKAAYDLLKRLSRKILYFLTIKEASDKVSYYWHKAFLLDYLLISGHLNDPQSARIAREALDTVLDETTTSPLSQLARQVTASTRHIFLTLRRVRQGSEDEVIAEKKSLMQQRWDSFAVYFRELAQHYDVVYEEIKNRPLPEDETALT